MLLQKHNNYTSSEERDGYIQRVRKTNNSHSLSLGDSDGSRTRAEVALNGHDLVVVRTETHALGRPGIKMCLDVDRSAGTLLLANGPELLEGARALDGWGVVALRYSDLVRAAVNGDRALDLGLRRRIVGAKVLNDVILDEGVACPAVHSEVGVAIWLVGTRVVDGPGDCQHSGREVTIFGHFNLPGTSWVPSLSTYEVATARPAHREGSRVAVGVSHIGAAIGPERVVKAIVCAGG
jgi:hypothetical protein